MKKYRAQRFTFYEKNDKVYWSDGNFHPTATTHDSLPDAVDNALAWFKQTIIDQEKANES